LQLVYYDRQAVWQVYKELSDSTCNCQASYSVSVDITDTMRIPELRGVKEEITKMAGNQRGGESINDRERDNMKKRTERIW